jgi:hypothetical protein
VGIEARVLEQPPVVGYMALRMDQQSPESAGGARRDLVRGAPLKVT